MEARPRHLLVSCNDAYAMPTAVMLTSYFESNSGPGSTVWLLRSGISQYACEVLGNVVEKSGAVFEPVAVDASVFDGWPTAKHISSETYLRLLVGEVLPPEVHRVLWLDGDVVVLRDLAPLFSFDLGDCALAACGHGPGMLESMVDHCRELGIAPGSYVNAGVLLIDVDAWRACDMRAAASALHESAQGLKFADQDMVNLIFKDRIAQLDPLVYNFRTNRPLTSQDEQRARQSARIVHYCGQMKPWMFSDIPLGDLWRGFYSKSPYGEEKLRLLSREGLSRMAARAKRGAGA